MIKPKVFIRADGNAEIGLGHVIRSLALAEMLKEDFDCVFATRFLTDYIHTEAMKVCNDVVKLPETDGHFDAFLSCLSGEEVVVLDNYFFTTDYQRAIKSKGCKLVCIDDMQDKHYVADIVINHAEGLTEKAFSTELYTKCLTGTKYALLRKPFLDLAKQPKKFMRASRAFVCFGGSDYNNITLRAVERLLSFEFVNRVFAVTGNAYLYKDELKQLSEKNQERLVSFSNIDAAQTAKIMSNSDFAIVPCSSILWECMAAKLPVITGYYVENQKQISDYFLDKNIGYVVGDFNIHLFTEQDISGLSQKHADAVSGYIDGDSGNRLNNAIKSLCHV